MSTIGSPRLEGCNGGCNSCNNGATRSSTNPHEPQKSALQLWYCANLAARWHTYMCIYIIHELVHEPPRATQVSSTIMVLSKLTERNPPPGGVSYLLCSIIKNQEEEDPPWRTTPKIDQFSVMVLSKSNGEMTFVYTYIYKGNIHIYIYIYVYTHIYIHTLIHIYIHICKYIYAHVLMVLSKSSGEMAFVIYIYIYIKEIYINIYIYVFTYIYIYTHCSCSYGTERI